MHPEYNRRGLVNDIALIKLNAPIDLTNPNINVAQMATPADKWFPQTCFILGWGANETFGYTDILKVAVYSILADKVREATSKKFNSTVSICDGYDGKGSPNICNSDSDGPLMCLSYQGQNVGLIKQFGIASYTRGKCDPKVFRPDYFGKVSYYYDWIQSVIKKLGP